MTIWEEAWTDAQMPKG